MSHATPSEPEFDALRVQLLPAGQEAVKQTRDGKFYPFGAELSADGTIKLVAPQPEPGQVRIEPSVVKLLAHFRERLTDDAFRAFGICFAVKDAPPGATQKADALMMHLESRNGMATQVFWPFRKKVLRGTEFGQHYAREVEPLIVGK